MCGQALRVGRLGLRRSRIRGLPDFGGELPVAALSEEILTPGEGQVRALVTVAGNPVLSTPNGVELERALEAEPMSAIIQTLVGFNMQFADPERGTRHMRNGFEMQPDNPMTGMYLGVGLGEFQGRFEEAIAPLEHSASMGYPTSVAFLASYQARLGNLEAAARAEEQLDHIAAKVYVSPFLRAIVSAGHGRAEETLDALEACLATGDGLGYIRMYRATFGFILDHPRAAALLQQVGGHLGR